MKEIKRENRKFKLWEKILIFIFIIVCVIFSAPLTTMFITIFSLIIVNILGFFGFIFLGIFGILIYLVFIIFVE